MYANVYYNSTTMPHIREQNSHEQSLGEETLIRLNEATWTNKKAVLSQR